MEVAAVIFDLDNTLSDRRKAFKKWTQRFIEEFLVDDLNNGDIQTITKLLINHDKDGYTSKYIFYDNIEDEIPWKHRLNRDEFVEYFYRESPKHATAAKGMMCTLDFIKTKKIPMGIITTGSKLMQNRKIDVLKIRDYFDVILISGQMGIDKPEPEIFNIACNELHVQKESTLYVGDNIRKDVWGSYNAGLIPVWKKGYFEKDSEGLPPNTISIHQIDELINIINN
ncbi:MAG: HAD family hydrolase [Clostridiales bacterium]|nr:HAD family hydrolase [Clostridiales bacterium]